MNAALYWTLVAVGVTLYGARVALDLLGAAANRVRREVRYYRARRTPLPALLSEYFEARDAMPRREARRLFVRGLFR